MHYVNTRNMFWEVYQYNNYLIINNRSKSKPALLINKTVSDNSYRPNSDPVIDLPYITNKKIKFTYLAPTNSRHSGIHFHLCTVSNGPKSSVRHSALSGQLWSNSIPGGIAVAMVMYLWDLHNTIYIMQTSSKSTSWSAQAYC